MASPVNETKPKPFLANKNFIEFLPLLDPIRGRVQRQAKLVEYVEGTYLNELIQEQKNFNESQCDLPFCNNLLKYAIQTLEFGIANSKKAADDIGTYSKPDSKESSSSEKHEQEESWSPELHEKFVFTLQQLVDSEDAQKRIEKLMNRKGLPKYEVMASGQKRKIWTFKQHMQFINCLIELGGIGVATLDQVLEALNDDDLTADDVVSQLGVYFRQINRQRNIGTRPKLGSKKQKLDNAKEDVKSQSKGKNGESTDMVEDKSADAKEDVKSQSNGNNGESTNMVEDKSEDAKEDEKSQSNGNDRASANMVEDKSEDAKENEKSQSNGNDGASTNMVDDKSEDAKEDEKSQSNGNDGASTNMVEDKSADAKEDDKSQSNGNDGASTNMVEDKSDDAKENEK